MYFFQKRATVEAFFGGQIQIQIALFVTFLSSVFEASQMETLIRASSWSFAAFAEILNHTIIRTLFRFNFVG
jgi:hypothetical protein